MPTGLPVIPETITVHLGEPDQSALNVTLPFADYVMNVASSEIYPTWPDSALRANIYAQVSFALNRIYTEFYRSRGYDFDITNSTRYDQYFVNGRDIFNNIRNLSSELFNDYLRRPGSVEPLFAQYCNGTTVTCDGLSQWGSVDLAQTGYTPYQILTNYYGSQVEIVQDAPVGSLEDSSPETPLRLSSYGSQVRILQIRLNRISDNYSSIPKIPSINGIYNIETENAVRAFQDTFGLTVDGIVGKATWYAVQRIYIAVKRLNSLNSEGLQFSDVSQEYAGVLRLGDTNTGVSLLQYYINYLSAYYETIPALAIDGIFGEDTRNAVYAVQNTFGLPVDGVVGEQTWEAITNAYYGIIRRIPVSFVEGNIVPYQGTILRQGDQSEEVRILQEYLNYISRFIAEIPSVSPTGYFGPQTQTSVIAFQRFYGLPTSGLVDAATWAAIADLYSDLYIGGRLNDGQYPGFEVGS
jgi:peptidoglycan hydrolase-like protein with peptidoglycan-binding domain